jgi:Na+/serine symporter
MRLSNLISRWRQTSIVLRIVVGLVIGAVLGLVVPQWTGIGVLGTVFVSALKAIAPVLVAVLVTASIAKAGIPGRHDVCFALRTPVIVEAMAAIVLVDLAL